MSNRFEFGLWEGKKLICAFRADYMNTTAVGIVEFWNREDSDDKSRYLVAVIVLGQGQYVTLKDSLR